MMLSDLKTRKGCICKLKYKTAYMAVKDFVYMCVCTYVRMYVRSERAKKIIKS